MKQVRFEFEELPYETLSQFGLTREMIEDLPMHILEELSHGRHSPVLPIKVNDDNGNILIGRMKENGVGHYPMLVMVFLDYLFYWLKLMQISFLR